MNIGIVGADSNHSLSFAKAINVDRIVHGVRVTHLLGDTAVHRTRTVAAEGQIPYVVKQPQELIGVVDAAVIAHRHPKLHLAVARPLLEAHLPLFVDKSLCCRTTEAKRFLARAATLRVPVCSFGVIPLLPAYVGLQREVRRLGKIHVVTSTGPCDVKCKWGGVFFYGIHQLEMIHGLLGYGVSHVQIARGRGENNVATLAYRNGAVATMNLIGAVGVNGAFFHLSVIGETGRIDRTIATMPYKESIYYAGIRSFLRTFKTGKVAASEESMLAAVAGLEALERSIAQRGRVRISI